MFYVPEFGLDRIVFTAIGVFVLWASWGKGGLSVKHLNSVLVKLGCPPNRLILVELAFTMIVGVVVTIAFVDPQTAQQAIAAGMGWTGLITKPTDAPSGDGQ